MMKAEAKKWGKQYAKSGDFPEPKLIPVPPGSIVFWERMALMLMPTWMTTKYDPEWAVVCSRAGPYVSRWHLHHLRFLWSEIPTVEENPRMYRALFQVYEPHVRRYPWGALLLAIERPFKNPIPVVSRRLDALLSFWEPLDTIRYVSDDFYPVSLADFVSHAYRDTLAMWVDRPTRDVKADLRTVINKIHRASADEIHKRLLRSARLFVETAPHLNHRQWLKTPGLLERELERLRIEEPDVYAELPTSGGSVLAYNLDRIGPDGAQS
jgi:hypothetical protein